MKNVHGGVLLLVKLQALATKSNTLPWVFFTFFKLHKWYKIAQNITDIVLATIPFLKIVRNAQIDQMRIENSVKPLS